MTLRSTLGGLFVTTAIGAAALTGCNDPRILPHESAPVAKQTDAPPAITATQFDELINRDQLTLVKFGATWCPPCHMLDANLDKIAGQLPADVVTRRIDTDENPELSARFDISSIPHTFLFKNGEVLDDTVGVLSGEELVDWVGRFK